MQQPVCTVLPCTHDTPIRDLTTSSGCPVPRLSAQTERPVCELGSGSRTGRILRSCLAVAACAGNDRSGESCERPCI